MKESLVNLLVFCLLFAVVALFVLGAYFLYNALVPGGRGLIFANPYAAALLPSLLVALVFSQYRAVHHPGRFTVTWLGLAGAFFVLLAFSIPLIQKAPPIRSPDAPPLVAGRFLTLEDKGSLLAPPGKKVVGQFADGVLSIPRNDSPMVLLDQIPFDPLNQRFLLPAEQGGPKAVVETGPERAYFQYPDFYQSVQTDLFAVYQTLKTAWETNALLLLAEAGAVTLLFMGLFFFFSFKTWPLVQIVIVLFLVRIDISFLAYSFQGLPLVVSNWLPGATFLVQWMPVFLVLLAGTTLLFMTMLTKPHRVETLS